MNINTKAISLIIPSKDSKKKLLELLRSIPNWEAVPNEIIIVDSSENKDRSRGNYKRWTFKRIIYYNCVLAL